MKLYYAPGACSLSPHIVAREAGVAIELVKVDLASHQTAGGDDYYRINPKGYVPALGIDDHQVLTEGIAIVQYLADRNPAAGLVPPAGTFERYRLVEWLAFISTEIHKTFSPLWNPATPEATREAAKAALERRFGYLSAQLAGRNWLLGDQFTVADAYAFTVLNWTRFLKIDLSGHPVLVAYLERVAARPKVREALTAEGLI